MLHFHSPQTATDCLKNALIFPTSKAIVFWRAVSIWLHGCHSCYRSISMKTFINTKQCNSFPSKCQCHIITFTISTLLAKRELKVKLNPTLSRQRGESFHTNTSSLTASLHTLTWGENSMHLVLWD